MHAVSTRAYIDKSIQSIEQRMDERIVRIEKMFEQVASESKTLRHTIWTTAITLTIGIASLVYALSQNMISIFGVGTSIKSSIREEVYVQTRELNAKLDKLLEAPPKRHFFHEAEPNTPSRRNKSDAQF